MGVPSHRGIRTDRYKLIHYYHEDPQEYHYHEDPQEYELYDLQSDPGENHNLYDDPRYNSLKAHLWDRIAQLRRETGDIETS